MLLDVAQRQSHAPLLLNGGRVVRQPHRGLRPVDLRLEGRQVQLGGRGRAGPAGGRWPASGVHRVDRVRRKCECTKPPWRRLRVRPFGFSYCF